MFSSIIDIVIFFPDHQGFPLSWVLKSFEYGIVIIDWNIPGKRIVCRIFHSSLLERKEEESIWHPGTSVITLSCIFYKHGNKLSIAHRLADSSQCQSHQNHQFLSVDCLFRNYLPSSTAQPRMKYMTHSWLACLEVNSKYYSPLCSRD